MSSSILGCFLLESGDANLSRWHELAVDRYGTVRTDEIANRASAAGEETHAPANLLELRRWRRRRRRGRLRRLGLRSLAEERIRAKPSAATDRDEAETN
jgi:hypothetical protein